jgi:hypothetical protein
MLSQVNREAADLETILSVDRAARVKATELLSANVSSAAISI